jgi:hypothetical protein
MIEMYAGRVGAPRRPAFTRTLPVRHERHPSSPPRSSGSGARMMARPWRRVEPRATWTRGAWTQPTARTSFELLAVRARATPRRRGPLHALSPPPQRGGGPGPGQRPQRRRHRATSSLETLYKSIRQIPTFHPPHGIVPELPAHRGAETGSAIWRGSSARPPRRWTATAERRAVAARTRDHRRRASPDTKPADVACGPEERDLMSRASSGASITRARRPDGPPTAAASRVATHRAGPGTGRGD